MTRVAMRLVMMVLLLGLLPAVVVAERRPGEDTLFSEAENLFYQGEDEAALSRLRAFVLRYHDSELTDSAYLLIGRIQQRRGRCEEALVYLQRIPRPNLTPAGKLLEGVCQLETGRTDDGLQQLRELFQAGLAGDDARLFYSSLFRAERAQGRTLPALAFAWRSLQATGNHSVLLAEAHELMVQQLTEAELVEAGFMFAGSPISQDATLQQARRALARRDEAAARLLLQQVLADPTSFPYRGDAERLLSQLSGMARLQRDAIGVLLPLTGRYAAYGEQVRRGMELALTMHNRNQPPARFIYRDSVADAEIAVQQFSALVQEDRVMAVAGPLTSAAAEAVATRAGSEQVPVLTLSQKSGVASQNAYIFRNSLTTELQAHAMARHAVRERGLTALGVLYPDNRVGRDFAYLFAREVASEGGLVVAMESYGDKDTDFRQPVRNLTGQKPTEKDQRPVRLSPQEELEELFVPEDLRFPPPFSGLFIPDYVDKIGLIAPQLAFYGLEKTQLLGINGWNSADLVRLAGRHVEGAVFVDGFFRDSPYPFVKEFIDLYYATYQEQPGLLEAQAYDVAGILLSLLDRPDIVDREDMRAALAALRDYPGVTGATSFDVQGEADKTLFLLQVQKGRIVQLD